MLGALTGLVAPQLLGRVSARIRPNPLAPTLPDQTAHAAGAGALRGGTSGLTGSEQDYYTDQGAGTIGYLPIAQDVTSGALAPAWFIPGDPGADPRDATVLRDFDRSPQHGIGPHGEAWGGSTRTIHNGAQNVQAGTLLPPTYVAPNAREVVAARDEQAAPDALLGLWSD